MFKKIALLLMIVGILLPFSRVEAGAKYYFSMPSPQESIGTTFEDNNIKIVFDMNDKLSKTEYPFKLTNKSNNIIIVNWNQAALIATDGSSHRVGHYNVAYLDISQGKQLQPTVIPQNSFINDAAFFADGLQFWGCLGWTNRANLYPSKYSDALKLVGTSRKFLLPLEINGRTIYYTFEIKVEKVEKN